MIGIIFKIQNLQNVFYNNTTMFSESKIVATPSLLIVFIIKTSQKLWHLNFWKSH